MMNLVASFPQDALHLVAVSFDLKFIVPNIKSYTSKSIHKTIRKTKQAATIFNHKQSALIAAVYTIPAVAC